MLQSESFIFGDSVKVSPILDSDDGQTTFKTFFPPGTWIPLPDYNDVPVIVDGTKTPNGEIMTLKRD